MRTKILWSLIGVLGFIFLSEAEARKRRKRRRVRTTHPIVLWAKTLRESEVQEERKKAAFKLSKVSLRIFQVSIIDTLINCTQDPDLTIKVLCTRAMERAQNKSHNKRIQNHLLKLYESDAKLRPTIVKTFTAREDGSPAVHNRLLAETLKLTKPNELVVHLNYFESQGSGSTDFITKLIGLYGKHQTTKVKMAVVQALSKRGTGQNSVVELLVKCTESDDTPLQLTCLGGLEEGATKDPRIWRALEKTIQSNDTDVLLATLDVINALPESRNQVITNRLVVLTRELQDPELREKAILSLGVCGTQTIEVVKMLQETLRDEGEAEGVRIASAIVLGSQSPAFPEESNTLLAKCSRQKYSQSLKTACQLGMQDLKTRTKMTAKNGMVGNRNTATKKNK